MNNYKLPFVPFANALGYISSVVIGNTLSPNFDVDAPFPGTVGIPTDVTVFRFGLPFSLTNFGITAVGFDTRFQAVKEFLDKPYVTAGRLIGILVKEAATIDITKDLDDYLKFKVLVEKTAAGSGSYDKGFLYIGIANSSLSQSYSPFGISAGAIPPDVLGVKIFDVNDLKRAYLQERCQVAVNTATGGHSIGAIPSGSSTGSVPVTSSNAVYISDNA